MFTPSYYSKVRFNRQCQNFYKYSQLVDFIKILIKDQDFSILEQNSLLDFYDKININTGEIKTVNRKGQCITPFKNAFYNGLEFRIYNTGTITIAGSLHKYWNSGAHNYNDFNFLAFVEVVNDLKNKFGINPQTAILKCLEVGVNITPTIPTNEFLDYCFLHKTKPFEYQKNSSEGKYKQVQHSQYIVKLYNKALHYCNKFDINFEILRFEIKYTKMEKLNKLGIYNLLDLQKFGLINFKNELITEFNNILFFDKTIWAKTKRLLNYSNPMYWNDLLSKPNKTNYYKHRAIFKQLTLNYSDKIQLQTTEIIRNKVNLLNQKGASIDTLIIKSIHTPLQINSDNTLCQITKLNISMQKDNSILLSHTGLRYYYKNERKVFEQIRRRYLSKKWHNSSFETQIKEIAHNIRNTKSNQKIKQFRIYKPQQTNMLLNFGFVNIK